MALKLQKTLFHLLHQTAPIQSPLLCKWRYMYKRKNVLFKRVFFYQTLTALFPLGDAHQWWDPCDGRWLETSPSMCRRRGNNHHSRVHLCHWSWQRQQQPGSFDCSAAESRCGAAEWGGGRSLHPSRHHGRDHIIQTHGYKAAMQPPVQSFKMMLFWSAHNAMGQCLNNCLLVVFTACLLQKCYFWCDCRTGDWTDATWRHHHLCHFWRGDRELCFLLQRPECHQERDSAEGQPAPLWPPCHSVSCWQPTSFLGNRWCQYPSRKHTSSELDVFMVKDTFVFLLLYRGHFHGRWGWSWLYFYFTFKGLWLGHGGRQADDQSHFSSPVWVHRKCPPQPWLWKKQHRHKYRWEYKKLLSVLCFVCLCVHVWVWMKTQNVDKQ